MPLVTHAVHPFWYFISRFGEAQILLPMALGLALLLWRRGDSARLAWAWTGWIALVAGITTISKLAFIGWGVGSARFDFTGFSGHAMFAAAIYPVLMALLAGSWGGQAPTWRWLGAGLGLLLAVLIAISRVVVDAHSVSEAVSGHCLGLLASAFSLRVAFRSRLADRAVPGWAPALAVSWLLVLPLSAPASITHDLVTRLALSLSGRDTPYQRSDLLRRLDRPTSQPGFANGAAG